MLFSTSMVRAVLDGSNTRRLVKSPALLCLEQFDPAYVDVLAIS